VRGRGKRGRAGQLGPSKCFTIKNHARERKPLPRVMKSEQRVIESDKDLRKERKA